MKKYFSFILIAILMTSLFSTAVFATDNNLDIVISKVEMVDANIYIEIAKAQTDADVIIASNVTPEKTAVEIDKIINKLIESTTKQVEKVVQYAYDNGIIVIKTYITVEIGGRSVEVDPLRVWED